jgi:murein DD-endopeptidase MepM/ murein hydrolase activator NlpD
MKIRKRTVLKIVVITALVFLAAFILCYDYFIDRYYLIKPLPVHIPIKIRVDKYGDGHFGAARSGYRHRGIDILAKVGTPVLACKSGWVKTVDYDKLSGNYIILSHRDNLKSLYLHLSKVFVREYMPVKQGQVIGEVGKTGNASYKDMKTHLHFEIRKNNRPQNILKLYSLESFDKAQKQVIK